MLAVVVLIEAVPGKEEALISALKGNARHSRTEETCHRWEWSRDIHDGTKFAIYELYDDLAAFEAHKASDHFAEWKTASADCIATKQSSQYQITDPQPA